MIKSKPKKVEEESQAGVCRICLGEEDEQDNPMISPCLCAGSMKLIHIDCLREWLKSKRSYKESFAVNTYCWKAVECELCKWQFPEIISTPDNKRSISLYTFEKPDNDYLVLESVTSQAIKIIHVINMAKRDYFKVGRGHDSDVRITDISVSRTHALIK